MQDCCAARSAKWLSLGCFICARPASVCALQRIEPRQIECSLVASSLRTWRRNITECDDASRSARSHTSSMLHRLIWAVGKSQVSLAWKHEQELCQLVHRLDVPEVAVDLCMSSSLCAYSTLQDLATQKSSLVPAVRFGSLISKSSVSKMSQVVAGLANRQEIIQGDSGLSRKRKLLCDPMRTA